METESSKLNGGATLCSKDLLEANNPRQKITEYWDENLDSRKKSNFPDGTDYKQLHAECAAELLNVLAAYDAAHKRADDLRYMLEKIVRFQSKTPEDRDDLLNDARKLLEASNDPS